MSINISISGAFESQSVQLLTNVINCLQSEKEDLARKCLTLENEKNSLLIKSDNLGNEKKDLATKCMTLEDEQETLKTRCSTLEDEKNELITKCTTLENEQEALKTKCSTLEDEKKDLATKCTTLENEQETLKTRCSTLEDEKKKLAAKCTTLEDEQGTLETRYSTLEDEKKEYIMKCAALDDEKNAMDEQIKTFLQEKTDRFIASIKQVLELLQSPSKLGLLNVKWNEYIEIITNDIDIFISEVKTIDDITRKIVSKNGWFAKVASIYWWSTTSNVRDFLPPSFQQGSGFHYSFCNLLNEIKLSGMNVTIPDCDFSNKIDNYKKDYSEDTIVQKLFPEYKPDGFVLCEINFVSFDGGYGTCIGYK